MAGKQALVPPKSSQIPLKVTELPVLETSKEK